MVSLTIYVWVAALVCCGVSFAELLDRYSHSTQVSTVIFNFPAAIYLLINFVVGALAVYVSTATGTLVLSQEIDAIGLLKAAGAGGAALAILRSNFATLSDSDGRETPIGLSALLDKVKQYLDRKIDLVHKVKSDKRISAIMKDVDADKARIDLPAFCLTGVKRCSKEEVEDLNTTLENLFKMHTMPVTRAVMMGHALYKLYGLEVLQSCVESLGDAIKIDANKPVASIIEDAEISVKLLAAKAKLLGRSL
jgi:hypothetical protein